MFGILASIIDGVLAGLVYGLAAMGLTLIWGVMDVINLTHGMMRRRNDGTLSLGRRVRHLALFHFAAGPDRRFFCRRRALLGRRAPHDGPAAADELLSTFSVNLILVGLGTAIWGTALFNVNVSLPGVTIDRYTFPGAHILAAVLAAVIAGALYLF